MNFGLKNYLAEESKRYDVVMIKKKLYLKETNSGKDTEWTLQNSGFGAPLMTLFPDQILVGMRVERGSLRYIQRISRKTGEVAKQEYIDFRPSEFDELVKLGALKGLA
jgi:hypothetical protein